MYEFNERELKFLDKWLKEIMDIKWDYEVITPDITERGMETNIYINIKFEQGLIKHRTWLTVKQLEFCAREGLLDD